MVVGAFGLAALLCGSIMAAGFTTFGAASQGFILNNYATADSLALLARIGISASIIFSFPLNFVGLREGVLDLLKLKARATPNPNSNPDPNPSPDPNPPTLTPTPQA